MVFKLPKCSLSSWSTTTLSDWTDSGKGQSPPEHASQPLIRPDQIVEYISQRFFSPLITPSQPARPIDFVRSANSKGLIWSEVVGTNRLLYRTKRGSWLAPYFQPLQLASTSFAIRTDTKKKAGSGNAKEKSKDSRPRACYWLNHKSVEWRPFRAYSQPLVRRKSRDLRPPLCSKESKWGGLRFLT